MATNADNGFAPVTLAVFRAPAGTTAPTSATAAPGGSFVDLGALSLEDGYEFTLPGEGDKTTEKAFVNGGTVFYTSRTPSDDLPTWKFTLMETSKATVEFMFGVTVTQTATDGSFVWKSAVPVAQALILDLVDGKGAAQRDFLPAGSVASVDAITIAGTDRLQKAVVTIEADFNQALGGNFKRWSTLLKTP